jgi:hypothetical protein
VISTVAFCPQPPALVPALASGAAAELAPLRAACGDAVGRLAAAEDVALLVMGDGSACRTQRAPGDRHSRAVAFDEAVVAALGQADARGLAALDPTLGAAVLAAGVPAWRVAGRLLADVSYDARLLYADDPYGVGYYVAAWTARG